MPSLSPRHLQILTALCNLPTAPYREHYVVSWLLQWARQHQIPTRRDKAGNLYLHYRRGPARKNPFVIEAHMDHPGFVVKHQSRNGTLHAEFRGGVKPSLFQNATAQFFLPDSNPQTSVLSPQNFFLPAGRWLPAKVLSVKKLPKADFLSVTLAPIENRKSKIKNQIPPGAIGMWNLPDAKASGDLFSARVCDDIGGIAAIVCLLEELIAHKIPAHIIAFCSRAEEVGFAGVLAACENQWLPKNSPVIGLENSKGSANAPQGNGPIIRVGDKTGIFSSALTHFISQAAGHIADDAPAKSPFLYQHKLMDGGTCNSTAFAAFGYDSAAMCVALGNYHNQSIKGDAGYGDGAKAGPEIASETINLRDFAGMVQILVETTKRIPAYKPGFNALRNRFTKLHQKQKSLLYQKFPA